MIWYSTSNLGSWHSHWSVNFRCSKGLSFLATQRTQGRYQVDLRQAVAWVLTKQLLEQAGDLQWNMGLSENRVYSQL